MLCTRRTATQVLRKEQQVMSALLSSMLIERSVCLCFKVMRWHKTIDSPSQGRLAIGTENGLPSQNAVPVQSKRKKSMCCLVSICMCMCVSALCLTMIVLNCKCTITSTHLQHTHFPFQNHRGFLTSSSNHFMHSNTTLHSAPTYNTLKHCFIHTPAARPLLPSEPQRPPDARHGRTPQR